MVLLFWCLLTQVVLEKRPLNECSVVVVVVVVVVNTTARMFHDYCSSVAIDLVVVMYKTFCIHGDAPNESFVFVSQKSVHYFAKC